MAFPPVFRFLCKTVNLVKFIFFAASVFYKGSFNLFLLCPVGDPLSFLFYSPLCLTLFILPHSPFLSLSCLPFWFSSLPLSFSSCGSECFNNGSLGNWRWESCIFFFPALISHSISGKLALSGGRIWGQIGTGQLLLVNYC